MRTFVLGRLFVNLTPLVLVLLSCQRSNMDLPNSWDTYRNQRYGFEFLYPSNWTPFPMPDNRDGRAFRDPKNPSLEIRGWAANKLPEIKALSNLKVKSQKSKVKSPEEQVSSFVVRDSRWVALKKPAKEPARPQLQNFTTEQGVTGELQVEVGSEVSVMTLTLSQGKVQYNWQGQCESKNFADNYRFFHYVATRYRLPSPEKK